VDQKILAMVDKAPLAQLGELFALLARKVAKHRGKNNGFVPFEVFASCLGIGGGYVCFEVIPLLELEGNQFGGYALKLRGENGEQGWEGQYQIPGVVFTSTPEAAFERLSKEVYGENHPVRLDQSNLEFVGIETHYEEERGARCFSLVWKFRLQKRRVMSLLSGRWEAFSNLDDQRIIGHHRRTLRWASQPKETRPVFADLT